MALSARKAPILVPLDSERECLHTLPLSALNLTVQQADTLALWGLHTLGRACSVYRKWSWWCAWDRRENDSGYWHVASILTWMVPEEPVFTLEEFVAFDAPVELMESAALCARPYA